MFSSPPLRLRWGLLLALSCLLIPFATTVEAQSCANTVVAEVVALDQPYFWNRLGAVQPHGMMYALLRDVEPKTAGGTLGPGTVKLRDDKRPRPLTLRVHAGDCLVIEFTNWLKPTPVNREQVASRDASVRVVGMQLVGNISNDGSHVGANGDFLVSPGNTATYTLYAEHEGTYLLYNGGALVGGEGDNGTISAGLFGAVNVEPAGSIWYRSQVTREEMDWISTGGTTASGQPKIDYNAVYPAGHRFAGTPILKILSAYGRILHSDLTAIIAGDGLYGEILPNPYSNVPVKVLPERNQPFREFTIIFHDEIAAVQAFPHFEDPVLFHTLHSARDAFAINYGTGGIGAEILANRFKLGPMAECTECLYEEFFLTSWAVGDSAMVVDVPANAPCSKKQIQNGDLNCFTKGTPKATKAYYPDDPSNVYHSYLNDHVKFRNLLAGSDDHHIFHLHAHQWLRSPDGDNSTYLDSQAIGQGTGFTYEIAHNGSGNRNKTPGDSIFHCHFYPHFAQGMWSMWRVHDVFEQGTILDEDGRPAELPFEIFPPYHERALPDGEIVTGTPIPGLVPLPGRPMAPMPSTVYIQDGQPVVNAAQGNPGYPFWIPGNAGHRPPHPPLDFFIDQNGVTHDGGLPRHVFLDGGSATSHETRLDFSKEVDVAVVKELNEGGEPIESVAMSFHAAVSHPTCRPDGRCDSSFGGTGSVQFITNGAPPIGGAPYADPCLAHAGTTTPPPIFDRVYKAANIETDVKFNKEGWHFPQQRFLALWQDVMSFPPYGNRPPEPFFFRANTYDCVTYLHTNLVPKEYELDDFQVRTPTDILGQHIHLVKFDVTSSDGSANGFNYEDGTLSPEEVRHRIDAINANGGIFGFYGGQRMLQAKPHPFFDGKHPQALGAQTTVQRWYVDDTLNLQGEDRTLRTVFTHDHFGPSTHQQVGLYAGLVVEHEGADWFHNETGVKLGGHLDQQRDDGGPTSWQAVIHGRDDAETFREFLLEFGDFQHAYRAGSRTEPHPDDGFAQPTFAINPPGRFELWDDLLSGKPWVYEKPALQGKCPVKEDQYGNPLTTPPPPPCPEAVSADDPGTKVVNYRQEPIALRVWDGVGNTGVSSSSTGNIPAQALGTKGDMGHVFRSDLTRQVTSLNSQPAFYDPLTFDLAGGDPYTPLLRAFEGDRVQVRILVGSHEEEHNFSIHGVRWLAEIAEVDSGFRNSQMMGISEHYEFEIPHLPRTSVAERGSVDFLWKAGASVDDLWDGIWGLMRVYKSNAPGTLQRLPNNPVGYANQAAYVTPCPAGAPLRVYNVSAVTAQQQYDRTDGVQTLTKQAFPGSTLVYNSRTTTLSECQDTTAYSFPGNTSSYTCTATNYQGPLHDPTAMVFVEDSWLNDSQRPYQPKPLVLRAAAGECVRIHLTNRLDASYFDRHGYSLMPNIIDEFNINQVKPSLEVGLHPQLVSYDVTRDDGVNVGFNPKMTVSPGNSRTFDWYAGQWVDQNGTLVPIPTEFGAVNLISADPIKHSNKGLVGALIVEPEGSSWTFPNARDKTVARVTGPTGDFDEFVTIFQTDVNLRYSDRWNTPVRPLDVSEDPAETGQNALNYRTEPVWFRWGYLPQTAPGVTRQLDLSHIFANAQVGGDPQTPIFYSTPNTPVRFRVLNPGGHSQQNVFGLHGHIWEEFPYVKESTVLDVDGNLYSPWVGSQFGHGPSKHFDALLKHCAGGVGSPVGDYMLRDMVPWYLSSGVWGLLRLGSEISGDGGYTDPLPPDDPVVENP